MFKRQLRWCLAPAVMLAAVGCGSIPDVVMDAAKESAKSTIEQKIDDLLAELGAQVDLSMFFPTGQADESAAEDDPGRDTGR